MTSPTPTASREPQRGRPRLRSDDDILSHALTAFADVGYAATSLRSLNQALGLSHGTINQRFGSKAELFDAAVEHGFGGLLDAIGRHTSALPGGSSQRERGEATIRAFLLASADRPELVRLMNSEGIAASPRLDAIFDRYIRPALGPLTDSMSSLSTRARFFLLVHGAAAPFTMRGLSGHFDGMDGPLNSPADIASYVDEMTEALAHLLFVD